MPVTGDITTQRAQVVTTGSTPTALTYDSNGNTLTDENGNGYQWDALNRLTAIIYNTGTYAGTHSEFTYDGLSRRVQILERTGTTIGSGTISSTKNFLWIGSEIAEERASDGITVTKRFFPQGEQQSGTNYYYTRDHLGSVREMCSSTGTITSRMAYDPYGRTTTVSGTVLPTKQYAGYYQHQTSGLALTKYRAYDSNTGRWLSRDPIGEYGGIDLYTYVDADPMDYIDRSGLGKDAITGKRTNVPAGGQTPPSPSGGRPIDPNVKIPPGDDPPGGSGKPSQAAAVAGLINSGLSYGQFGIHYYLAVKQCEKQRGSNPAGCGCCRIWIFGQLSPDLDLSGPTIVNASAPSWNDHIGVYSKGPCKSDPPTPPGTPQITNPSDIAVWNTQIPF